MIDHKAIRAELKRALLHQQNQQKITVQKQVTRNNTTFMQTFHVNPNVQNSTGSNSSYGSIAPQRIKRTISYPGSFANLKEAENVLGAEGDPKGAFEVWKSKLSSDVLNAINSYTGRWFIQINGLLRKTITRQSMPPQDFSKANRYTSLLESSLGEYELKENIVLHRQVGMNMLSEFQQNFNSGKKLYYDPGFFSTTPIADSFKKQNGFDLIIKVPKGKGRGAWIKPLSRYPRENEFLLNNHSLFTIDNINKVDGRWRVELSWIKRAAQS